MGAPGRSRLAVLEGSGHHPFIEEAAAFWRLVADCLAGRRQERAPAGNE
jgi:pimeloyl-ACP methyl ester carboxylesterase